MGRDAFPQQAISHQKLPTSSSAGTKGKHLDRHRDGSFAVHVPDGFIDMPTSVGTGLAGACIIGLALRGARREMNDRTAPLAGLTAAAIFAVQLISFPIAAGTSAHVLGVVLAAVLIGPCTGLLCATVVLGVQSLVLAYGGVSALGASMLSMDAIPLIVGYLVFLLLRKTLPSTPKGVAIAAGVAAGISVPAGALMFSVIYAIGGVAGIPLSTVATAVIGFHLIIGVVEGIVTALIIRQLLIFRPDIVRGSIMVETQ